MKGKKLVKKIGAGLGALVFCLGLNSCEKEYNTSKHRFIYNIFTEDILELKGEDIIKYSVDSETNNLVKVKVNGTKYGKGTLIYQIAEKKYREMLNEKDSIDYAKKLAKSRNDVKKRSIEEERDLEIIKY